MAAEPPATDGWSLKPFIYSLTSSHPSNPAIAQPSRASHPEPHACPPHWTHLPVLLLHIVTRLSAASPRRFATSASLLSRQLRGAVGRWARASLILTVTSEPSWVSAPEDRRYHPHMPGGRQAQGVPVSSLSTTVAQALASSWCSRRGVLGDDVPSNGEHRVYPVPQFWVLFGVLWIGGVAFRSKTCLLCHRAKAAVIASWHHVLFHICHHLPSGPCSPGARILRHT